MSEVNELDISLTILQGFSQFHLEIIFPITEGDIYIDCYITYKG
ncbi:hypothetical protein [Heyndrickxia acidicola]|uniref:Uncharacterized protein n=1 Tax=Heyndrickxia acidicola TaxID=209389 RepID=A0ABU6MIR2_9BACI|nr:hypothetical protein [Heyndrickxia acidicola]MED1204566.1 hypothetical protein [Heyndrickxia acidicola]